MGRISGFAPWVLTSPLHGLPILGSSIFLYLERPVEDSARRPRFMADVVEAARVAWRRRDSGGWSHWHNVNRSQW